MEFKRVFVEMLDGLVKQYPNDLERTGDGDTYYLQHRRQHTIRWYLHYSPAKKCFRGYVLDNEDRQTQAVVTIYTVFEAALFCTAAENLFWLRAKRRGEAEIED